jgi:hypothetical protein
MEIKNLLEGLMLGDGGLERRKITHNPVLRIVRQLTDKDYLLWSAKILEQFLTLKGVRTKSTYDARTGKTYQSIILRTKSCPAFVPLYERWYKNKIKTLPSDFVLNREILQVWFADDGTVYIEKGKLRRKCRFNIKIATHGFSLADVKTLQKKLETFFGFPFKIYQEKDKEQWTIRLLQKEYCKKFLRLIDKDFPLLRKSLKWRDPECFVFVDDPLPICIYCYGKKSHKYNIINNEQYYHCLECGRNFAEHGRPRKKYSNATYKYVGEYWKWKKIKSAPA